jgi:hypothetical protein
MVFALAFIVTAYAPLRSVTNATKRNFHHAFNHRSTNNIGGAGSPLPAPPLMRYLRPTLQKQHELQDMHPD